MEWVEVVAVIAVIDLECEYCVGKRCHMQQYLAQGQKMWFLHLLFFHFRGVAISCCANLNRFSTSSGAQSYGRRNQEEKHKMAERL